MKTETKDRDYLVAACKTEVGREYLTRMGYGAIVDRPADGDDESTAIVARQLRKALHQDYGF